jgi:hypothetical protein
MQWKVFVCVACAAMAEARADRRVCTWDQWGGAADHDGATCVAAQPALRQLAHIVFDPFEFQEIAENRGELTVHYQAPLTDDRDNFFMMHKAGAYVSCDPPGSTAPGCGRDRANILGEIWTEKAYHFGRDGGVEERWTFASDWKPIETGFEQMFQPALWGPFLYVPGRGGSVFQVLAANGAVVQRLRPFHELDPNTYVTGGVTIDRLGFLYWNVVHTDPVTGAHAGYIVAATPWGATRAVAYDTLIPGAPAATDLCFADFSFTDFDFPWPPPGNVLPPQIWCGPQRPGLGVTPAIGRDGTVFTASVADSQANYSYVIALHPDLSLAWATSLRGLVNDGCGVETVPPWATPDFLCPPGTPIGIDPTTNLPPAQQVNDSASSAPVALPDGGVLFGAFRDYDAFRGILLKFDRDGAFAGSYDFGWDTTPAIYEHDGTYSVITKDNHYIDQFPQEGPFFITQLSADLDVEWQYENTTEQACARQADGTLAWRDRDPDATGFEWCVNAPVVDRDGRAIAVAEDGNLYVIGQDGVLESKTFLNQALGAAYTPSAIDARGRIYALNNGELSIFGR